jgi:hypothetical protein
MKKITAGFMNIPEVLPDEMDIIDLIGFGLITTAIFIVITKLSTN